MNSMSSEYNIGLTQEDAFRQQVTLQMESDNNVGRLMRWRINRRLRSQKFVRLAMEEYHADMYWDESADEMPLHAIDWKNIDWERLLKIILTIISMFA